MLQVIHLRFHLANLMGRLLDREIRRVDRVRRERFMPPIPDVCAARGCYQHRRWDDEAFPGKLAWSCHFFASGRRGWGTALPTTCYRQPPHILLGQIAETRCKQLSLALQPTIPPQFKIPRRPWMLANDCNRERNPRCVDERQRRFPPVLSTRAVTKMKPTRHYGTFIIANVREASLIEKVGVKRTEKRGQDGKTGVAYSPFLGPVIKSRCSMVSAQSLPYRKPLGVRPSPSGSDQVTG
jgi:hypothetical protein